MEPIDDRTPNLGLPLPHPDNDLSEDVTRLRSAILQISTWIDQVIQVAGAAIPTSKRGAPNGVAPLDAQGFLPSQYLPESLFGAMKLKGSWNATTNVPTIPAASTANEGWYYIVSQAGSVSIDGTSTWLVGDWIFSDGTKWDRIKNSDAFDASAIQSGVLSLERIPQLDQSRIPLLDVSKIPLLDLDRIPQMDLAHLPALPVSKTTGLQEALDAKFPTAGGSLTGKLWTYQVNAAMAQNDGSASIEVRNASGTGDAGLAMIGFHAQGYYGIKLGVRADGYFGLGGWSSAAWRWYSAPNGDMIASGNVGAYSDPRLKEDVQRIRGAMAIISQLDGVRFTWNGRSKLVGKPGQRGVGVLADQVEAVLPEIVGRSMPDEENDGEQWRVVAYDKLVPVLIEAVKELNERVAALEAR